jgi:hypothetical protein
MKSLILVSVLTAITLRVTAQFTNQSAPFHLILHSDNKTYNNLALFPCHEGAGIEALCPGPFAPSSSVFRFNTSSNEIKSNSSLGEQGLLTWDLSVNGGDLNISQSMNLYYDPITNVAVPMFEFGYQVTYVAFDDQSRMNIQSYIDDTKFPPRPNENPYGPLKAYYRWYVCETYYIGYLYKTLAWVLGSHSPENPTCVRVTVTRVFA